jgi:Gas vesicle synthesis protein GvpL/GvpF
VQAQPVEEAAGRGSAYLRARAESVRREDAQRASARRLAEKVDARLGPHALEQRQTLVPTERLALRLAFLVDRERAEAFKNAFEDLRAEDATHRFLLSGPWPPYTFVRRDDDVDSLLTIARTETRGRAWSVEAISETGSHEEV